MATNAVGFTRIAETAKGNDELQLQHLKERLQSTNELNGKELAVREKQLKI